jgi:hypothetical protein
VASGGRRLRQQDPDLVREESPRLADAMLQMLAAVSEDGRSLAVGHSPLLEAGVYGLTGRVIEPLGKCEGVLVAHDGERVRLEEEYRLKD